MPPKGGNAKKESGRAKKAENEGVKLNAQERKAAEAHKAKEAKEAKDWEAGAKGSSKADAAAAKQADAARKKAERDALLAAEEASAPSKTKAAPKAGGKKKAASDTLKPGPGGGIAAFTVSDPLGVRKPKGAEEEEVAELSATGIEAMMEAMEVVNAKTDKQSMGAKAGLIEQHPERRFKAAFAEYLDREMPILKEEHPGLRKNQMQDMLFKRFQKAPENPFNQVSVAYNATKDEKLGQLQDIMDAREEKYKVKP